MASTKDNVTVNWSLFSFLPIHEFNNLIALTQLKIDIAKFLATFETKITRKLAMSFLT